MKPSWTRVDEVFQEALDEPEAERAAWVRKRCGDDAELRRRVEAMLRADAEAGDFLEQPPTVSRAFELSPLGEPGSPVRRHEEAELPETLGPYTILRPIGEGGSSTVYLGERRDTYRQKVAIKILRLGGTSREIARRFERERQILAGLDHPLIARILDGGETPAGRPYLVMEFVDGAPIDRHCRDHGLDTRGIVALFLRVLEAVEHAHRNLVVHRDIKPGNVLVRADDRGGAEPRLVDFGIAKLLNADLVGGLDPTRADLLLMTPSYASPEQIGGGQISTSSDIYSLGVLLYKLLTGALPYDAPTDSVHALVTAICDTEPVPASRRAAESVPERVAELSGDLDQILAKALAKRPEARYRSVDRFADDLERFLDGRPVSARPASWLYRAGKFVRRNRISVGLAALVAVLVAASALQFVVQSARTERALVEAQTERSTAQAVQGFLQEILGSADPMGGEGQEVSVLEAIRAAEDTIAPTFADQPEVEAEVRAVIGVTYFQLGDYDAAERMHLRAVELRRGLGLRGDLAESLGGLARVYRRQGRLEEAETTALECLALLAELGADAPTEAPGIEARTRLELGAIYRNQWRLEAAERELTLAREGFLREPEHFQGWEAAGALQTLATVQAMQAKYAQAAENLHQALDELVPIYGESHGTINTVHYNLGFLRLLIGDYERSTWSFGKAIEIGVRRYGSDDAPKTGMAHAGLGEALAARGRFRDALVQQERALAIFEASVGGGNPLVADVLNAMAWTHLALGEIETAEGLARRAADIVASASDPDLEEQANCRELASDLAAARGDWTLAEEHARVAWESFRTLVGEDHHDAAVAASRLGAALTELGLLGEADALLADAVAIFDRSTLPVARRRVLAHLRRARNLAAQGRTDEARTVLRGLDEDWPDYAGPDDPLTALRDEVTRQLTATAETAGTATKAKTS